MGTVLETKSNITPNIPTSITRHSLRKSKGQIREEYYNKLGIPKYNETSCKQIVYSAITRLMTAMLILKGQRRYTLPKGYILRHEKHTKTFCLTGFRYDMDIATIKLALENNYLSFNKINKLFHRNIKNGEYYAEIYNKVFGFLESRCGKFNVIL